MNDFQNPDKNEILTNLKLLYDKLAGMIPKQPPAKLDVIELEISGMMHEMEFFKAMIEIIYPLERTYEGLKSNPINNIIESETIEKFVQAMDFNLRKSFLTVTQFNLESLLGVIAKEHGIIFKERQSLLKRYIHVMNYFEINHNDFLGLLKTYHYVRNTLHSGTKITEDFGPNQYKGCTFEAKKGQDYIKFADWCHFTWFTSEVLDIFVTIIESKKYKFRN